MLHRTTTLLALFALVGHTHAQNTFEITIAVPGLTNVAGGQQLPDGGFVFGGELNDGLVVVRTDSTGAVLWTRSLAEGANEEGLYGRSLAVSGDRILMGGYAMGPNTAVRDGILHILDLDGTVLHQRRIDVGMGSNAIHSLTGTPSGALIAGRRDGANSYDMLLQHVDQDGVVQGSWSYGSSQWDWAYEAILLNDDGMALVGYGDGLGGPAPNAYLVRTDDQGQELWARGIDGASADEAYTVMEDAAAGDLYVGGTTLGMGTPGTRGFITKFNADGTHQWTRIIDNAFDVIGLVTIVPGRYGALVRAQNMPGGHGNYDALLLVFNAQGDLVSNRLFGTVGSEYPVALARTADGGVLVTSYKSGGGTNAIHAVLTDEFGVGGCTGMPVTVQWSSHTPTIIDHSSIVGSGHAPAAWPTNTQASTLNREFACCTYPVDASFSTTPGDALAYTFTNTSSGAGTASWTIGTSTYTGDVVEHAFPQPGTYTVCITVEGVCASDTQCEEIAVASTGLYELGAASTLQLHPNPTSDHVRLTATSPIRTVQVIDATGRAVLEQAGQGTMAMQIDLSALYPGVFVLCAWTDAGVVRHPVVKR